MLTEDDNRVKDKEKSKYICTSIKRGRRKLALNVLKCLIYQEGKYILW